MRARHLSTAPTTVALAILLLVATACASAAGPGSAPPAESSTSTEVSSEPSPEPTPAPTPEPEPSEPALACLDPEIYALLISDYRQWTAEDMHTLGTALEAYDFSGYDLDRPETREFVEAFAAGLLRGEPYGDPAIFQLMVQAAEIPILPCD